MKYKMCCRVDQNCPTVDIKENVEITDDFNGKVVMTKKEFKKLLTTNYGTDL